MVGVVMEVFWEKHWYKSTSDFRRSEKIRTWGARILIFGIVWEVISAGTFAIKEEVDARKIKNEIDQNKPRTLSLEQQRGIRSTVSLIQDKPPLTIFINEAAPDAESLGIQLEKVFVSAGFKVSVLAGVGSGNGVSIGKYGEATNLVVIKIIDSLRHWRFAVETNGGFESMPAEIILDIEPK